MLFAEDIGPAGTERDVYFADSGYLNVTSTGNAKERMPYIAHSPSDKKLGLNRTNCKTLETLTGSPRPSKWRGWFTIVIIRTKAPDRFTGTMIETDAIRIAPTRPNRPPPDGAAPRRTTAPQTSRPNAPDDGEAAEIARIEREHAAKAGRK
jgi:hypothetical protein